MNGKFDLVLRYMGTRNRVVKVAVDPELAWGIVFSFVMLDMYIDKYVGMRAQVLRPGVNGRNRWHVDTIEAHDIRMCLDLGVVSPNGDTVSLVAMQGERLFAGVISENGLVATATVDASANKLRKIMALAECYGPHNQETIARYCGCVPKSVSAVNTYRLVSVRGQQNPLPRFEITDEYMPFITVRAREIALGNADHLDAQMLMRRLVKLEMTMGEREWADTQALARG